MPNALSHPVMKKVFDNLQAAQPRHGKLYELVWYDEQLHAQRLESMMGNDYLDEEYDVVIFEVREDAIWYHYATWHALRARDVPRIANLVAECLTA